MARRRGRDARLERRPGDQDGAGARADAARERDLRRGDGARRRPAPARDEGERGGGDLAGLRARRGNRLAGQGRARATASRSSGRGRGSGPSPRPATGRCTADEPTLFEIWVCADGYWCDHTKLLCPGELRADYRELEAGLLEVYGRAIEHCRPGASLAELDRLVRDGIAELGYPGQPTHPICHGVGARAHEPPYAHQAGGGEVARGDGARDRAGLLLGRRRRPAGRGQLPDHGEQGAEKLSSFPDGVVPCLNDLIWTGSLNDRYASAGRSACTTRRCATGSRRSGVVLDPDEKLEIARLLDDLGIDRIEAGFPRVSDDDWQAVRTDRSRGPARRDLGLLARRSGRPRGARRARRALLGDRVAHLRPEARGDRRLTREDARAHHERHALRCRARHPRGLLRRRLDARRARLLPAGVRERDRGGRTRGRRRRHARDRLARGGRPTSSARPSSGSTARPCTSTATTTSASRPHRPSRPCEPGRRTSTARSTAWASAPATRTSARSR